MRRDDVRASDRWSGRDNVRAIEATIERTPVRAFGLLSRVYFIKVGVNCLPDHMAHTTQLALHFLLIGELAQRIHLVLVDFKVMILFPFGRTGVGAFARTPAI